jgi:hypothetical protein
VARRHPDERRGADARRPALVRIRTPRAVNATFETFSTAAAEGTMLPADAAMTAAEMCERRDLCG